MKLYDVFFEIYGKKMKATVEADNESKAKQIIANKIIFHKVVEKEKDLNNKSKPFDTNDFMKGFNTNTDNPFESLFGRNFK